MLIARGRKLWSVPKRGPQVGIFSLVKISLRGAAAFLGRFEPFRLRAGDLNWGGCVRSRDPAILE